VEAGSVSRVLSGFEDWMPTLLALTGSGEAIGDGLDLTPALLMGDEIERAFLYREFAGYGGQQAVWFGKWKGIRPRLDGGETTLELYDLEADPGESVNLAHDHPDVVARMEAVMRSEHVPSDLFPLQTIDGD
jgi:arylsulfatase A-like enzyme